MRTITIVNQKGGCGKTTTAINLAAVYARRGRRALIIDMDPQSHCAAGLGVPESRIELGIGEAMLADHRAPDFDPDDLIWEVSRHLYLAPSTVRLAALEAPGGGLHARPDRDRRLASLVQRLADRFDICLIDCPPTIGLLTFNALRAAREALIPVETGYFALKGAEKQWTTIQRTIAHIGRPIACHLLPTLHKPDAKLSRDILDQLQRRFAGQIIPVTIRDHDALREAASFGQPAVEYAPDSEAVRDFTDLADWLDEHAQSGPAEVQVCQEPSRAMLDVPLQREPGGAAEQMFAGRFDAMRRSADLPGDAPNGEPGSGSGVGGRATELARRLRERAVHRTGETAADANGARPEVDAMTDGATMADATADAAASAAAPASDANGADPAPNLRGEDDAQPPAARVRPVVLEQRSSRPALRFADDAAPANERRRAVEQAFGVRQTNAGVLFLQPAELGCRIGVVGDFNGWRPGTHDLHVDETLGVAQLTIPLAPGVYQYQIVVDGRRRPDAYNDRRVMNAAGEVCSVLTVAERSAAAPAGGCSREPQPVAVDAMHNDARSEP